MCLQQRAKALGPRPGKTPIDVSGACAYAKSEGCCPAPLEKIKGKKKRRNEWYWKEDVALENVSEQSG